MALGDRGGIVGRAIIVNPGLVKRLGLAHCGIEQPWQVQSGVVRWNQQCNTGRRLSFVRSQTFPFPSDPKHRLVFHEVQ
jgi:hypothetical protein